MQTFLQTQNLCEVSDDLCYPRVVVRPWQEIARELLSETDQERVLELTEELNHAMAEQLTAGETAFIPQKSSDLIQ
jgi:hypothetical protein